MKPPSLGESAPIAPQYDLSRQHDRAPENATALRGKTPLEKRWIEAAILSEITVIQIWWRLLYVCRVRPKEQGASAVPLSHHTRRTSLAKGALAMTRPTD